MEPTQEPVSEKFRLNLIWKIVLLFYLGLISYIMYLVSQRGLSAETSGRIMGTLIAPPLISFLAVFLAKRFGYQSNKMRNKVFGVTLILSLVISTYQFRKEVEEIKKVLNSKKIPAVEGK